MLARARETSTLGGGSPLIGSRKLGGGGGRGVGTHSRQAREQKRGALGGLMENWKGSGGISRRRLKKVEGEWLGSNQFLSGVDKENFVAAGRAIRK